MIKAIFEVSFQEVIDPIPCNSAHQMSHEVTPTTSTITSVRPNPNNGSFVLDYSVGENDIVTYEIYSITGSMIKSEKLIGGSQQQQINLDVYPSGTYLLRMNVNGIPEFTERIIITE